jgi:hypothetical protein
VGQAFALQPRPGSGRIYRVEMAAAVEFAREFEVVEDAEDRLANSLGFQSASSVGLERLRRASRFAGFSDCG